MSDEFADYAFQNGTREDFVFEGRVAALIKPFCPVGDGRWAIYTEYFGAFPSVAEALLAKGFYIARLKNSNRWGMDEDQRVRWRFADYLDKTRGLSHRCIPIGMSCGGLHAIRFAALHPERIAAMYLDAPVVNLLSCPMGLGRTEKDEAVLAECLEALGLSRIEMLAYRKHPLDALPVLAINGVPVVMLYGTADRIVPFEENGALLDRMYREKNAPLLTIRKEGCGHHPHGLDKPEIIVDFLLRYV